MKAKIIGLISLVVCSSAFAEIAVVVHPSNANAPDAKTIKRIFIGKAKTFSDGSQAVPINQTESSGVTAEFNKKVLNKSERQLKAYWSKLVFTGKGTPPRQVTNDEEMLKLIAANPNLIGYIDASKVDDSVKTITTF